MKLAPAALNKISPRLGHDIFTVVLHGDNAALIRRCVDQIRTALPHHQHTTLHADDWGKDSHIIYDLMLTPSLMGGDPCVILRAESDFATISESALTLGKQLRYGVMIVVTSGTIKATHALRKWAEAEDKAAIIGCYEETHAACMVALKQGLAGYQIDPDALLFAETTLGTQMTSVEAALKTLPLLVHPRTTITLEDMQHVAIDYEGAARDLAFAYLLRPKSYWGDLAAFVKTHAQAQPTPYIMVIRAVMDILKTLHTLHTNLQKNHGSLESALTTLKPPLFFKDKPSILSLMKRYDAAAVLRGIEHSLVLEKALKSKPTKVSCLMFEHG